MQTLLLVCTVHNLSFSLSSLHLIHSYPLRVIKKVPELVESFIERAASLLNDKNQGVMLTGATLMLQV